MADGKNIHHFDISPTLIDNQGELKQELYNRDKLNLSPKGYQAWANALLPILSKFGFED
ncbi:hypothetical protein OAP38_04135 [Opitutales bacterium]|uniref:hypothetical protein n=1 Tax=Candidatus Chordibacter forsetii TaxID=3381758 RepID=UPI002318FC5E|nr:hypothetical protein [Opitutales bacterium]MDC0646915.1 hypothetical protein [Opitutales bacterium]